MARTKHGAIVGSVMERYVWLPGSRLGELAEVGGLVGVEQMYFFPRKAAKLNGEFASVSCVDCIGREGIVCASIGPLRWFVVSDGHHGG